MDTVEAISSDSVTGLSLGVIAALVVIGLLLAVVIAKAIVRIVIVIVVIVLAVVVWVQRSKIEDKFDNARCGTSATFFGIDVQPPDDVQKNCGKS